MLRETGSTERTEAHIRQLCGLGLGGEAIMPTLLRELHGLIPSHYNSFIWLDGRGGLKNLYSEGEQCAGTSSLYADEFTELGGSEVTRNFHRVICPRCLGVQRASTPAAGTQALYRIGRDDPVLCPMTHPRILRLCVRSNDQIQGILQLQREQTEGDYTAVQERHLGRLQPYIAQALFRREDTPDEPLVESGESGLIIVDRTGQVVALSPRGRRLLYLSIHPSVTQRPGGNLQTSLPVSVVTVCSKLGSTALADLAAPPPAVRYRNVWGGFTFQAYRLNATETERNLIGLTIAREEPLLLRLTRGSWNVPLSSRQREVAVLLASGLSHQDIADRLEIRRHTAVTHSRWIYSKLNVHESLGLRNKLLEASLWAVH